MCILLFNSKISCRNLHVLLKYQQKSGGYPVIVSIKQRVSYFKTVGFHDFIHQYFFVYLAWGTMPMVPTL